MLVYSNQQQNNLWENYTNLLESLGLCPTPRRLKSLNYMDEAWASYRKQEGGHRISSVGDVRPSFEDMQKKL